MLSEDGDLHLRVPIRMALMSCSEIKAASPGLKSPSSLFMLRPYRVLLSRPNLMISWKSSVLSNMKVRTPPRPVAWSSSGQHIDSLVMKLGVPGNLAALEELCKPDQPSGFASCCVGSALSCLPFSTTAALVRCRSTVESFPPLKLSAVELDLQISNIDFKLESWRSLTCQDTED